MIVMTFQIENVMRLIFVWSMEKHLMMEEWRYVWMESGAQCAMTDGISEMLKLCVDNLGIMDVSLYILPFAVAFIGLFLLSASYSLLSPSSRSDPLYVLDDVHCMSTETKLSDCSHSSVGVRNCYSGEAGVICTSRFVVNLLNKWRKMSFSKVVTCEEGTVQLVGGDDVSRGRVLYCYNGTWYSLCSDNWGITGKETKLLCQSLGYITSNHGKSHLHECSKHWHGMLAIMRCLEGFFFLQYQLYLTMVKGQALSYH